MLDAARIAACLIAGSALADVMPHCGGREVVVREPGQDCGAHGPGWRGDCRGPAACFRVDPGGALCTRACSKDADCSALGPGFTCSARGIPYERPDDVAGRPVCGRAGH